MKRKHGSQRNVIILAYHCAGLLLAEQGKGYSCEVACIPDMISLNVEIKNPSFSAWI